MPDPDRFELDDLRARVRAYTPRGRSAEDPRVWAATALVAAPGEHGPDIAFIQRPSRPGDRWSGQMALPGGKREPQDRDAVATAAREAREEVGLELGEPVGRLDDVKGRVHAGIVATFVFTLDDRPALCAQPGEVETALWIPLGTLLSAEAAFRYAWGTVGRFPAIRHGEHVIWGLTHRILGSLAGALGVDLPAPG